MTPTDSLLAVVADVSHADRVRRRRAAERAVVEDLLLDPDRSASAGAVVRVVVACSQELSAAGVEHELPAALAAMARARLTALERTG